MAQVSIINNEIKIYAIEKQYIEYLHKFDNRVSLKENRRFSGIILRVNSIHYLIPLTSRPLRNNGKKRNSRTTVEIYNEHRELIAALLINNMIPVSESSYSLIDVKNEPYKDYLNNEIIYLRNEKVKREITRKVENVFRMVIDEKDEFMTKFCCDFETLEKKCLEYNTQSA